MNFVLIATNFFFCVTFIYTCQIMKLYINVIYLINYKTRRQFERERASFVQLYERERERERERNPNIIICEKQLLQMLKNCMFTSYLIFCDWKGQVNCFIQHFTSY